ncbi:hypothetical protein BGZ73_003486 [Actinomortierella ambigua]|nr:hypothetical protein BGZ73_003486 [Actinomortierella ambigua]
MEALDKITEEEKTKLENYLAVTGQNDIEAAIAILEQHSWNLERAVGAQFGDVPGRPRPDESLGGLGVDDPAPPTPPPVPPAPQQPTHTVRRQPASASRGLLSLLTWPLNTFWSVTWSILTYFYTLFPQTFRQAITGQSTRTGPSRPPQDPGSVAARFLREFEENYGTTHPDFHAGGYTAALNRAKNDLKFLFVYLHSVEHDATDKFCRETLTNSELVGYLRSNDYLVWGGNVAEVEAFQVATTLQTARYPFIGVIALSQDGYGSAKMVLIDRIEGPNTPQQIIQRLTQLQARHSAALNRLRAERREREVSRQLRQQQDDAYQQSLQADREKAQKAREAARIAERERLEQERHEAERVAALERKERHLKWLYEELPEEPAANEPGCARLSFKLWNGERVIRRFRGTEPVENVYVFIETIEYREDGSKAETDVVAEEDKGYQHVYDFVLISPFPRTKVTQRDQLIKDVPALWPSASLVVELVDEEGAESDAE